MDSIAKRLEAELRSGQRLSVKSDVLNCVVRFDPAHTRLVNTFGFSMYVTEGVARHSLYRADGQSVSQELMVLSESARDPISVAALLATVAEEVVAKHAAVRRGAVFGPHGRLFPDSEMTALFASYPFLVMDSRLFQIPERRTICVLLVAISTHEAELALKDCGAFEEYLEATTARSPVWGFSRPSPNSLEQ